MVNDKKRLIIVRGVAGAGKSTFVETCLRATKMVNWFEADMFFEHANDYKFDASKLGAAHGWCQLKVATAMQEYLSLIVVSNTFTTEKEMKPYFELAEQYGYDVVSLIVENRHGNKSVHNVPEATIQKMVDRFQVKLA